MAHASQETAVPLFSAVIPSCELSGADKKRFDEIQAKQITLFQKLRENPGSPEKLEAMSCASHEQSAEFWKNFCEESHDSFQRRHMIGIRKWTRKYQDFGKKAAVFMSDIKPILDACRQIGQPYTASAIGVASNKAQIEGKLVQAFESISDRLSGFKILTTCFSLSNDHERKLRRRILLAHLEFVDLAMEITIYYIQPAYRRWSIAIFKSAKFQDMIDKVNNHVNNVHLICEELLSLHVSQMKYTIKNLQMGQATDHLSGFLKLLGVPTWSLKRSQEEISHYRGGIEYEQWQEEGYDQMSGTRIEKFRQEGTFAQWSESANPAMLILTGINNDSIVDMKAYCWLSPIALDAIERCRNDGVIYAFYTFCNGGASHRSTGACLSVVAAQLLSARAQGLGESHLPLLSHAQEISRIADGDDDSTKVKAIGQFLCETIKAFDHDETIYIIIDRLDLCEESRKDDIPRIMADVLNESTCVVKALLVTQWEYDWRLNEREIKARLHPPNTLWVDSRTQGYMD